MNIVILYLNIFAAIFAVFFIAYYLRILKRAREAGPEPLSWIVAAVGLSLMAAYAVIEVFVMLMPVEVFFRIQRVYFMLGNMIVFGVLYRLWRNMGDGDGW